MAPPREGRGGSRWRAAGAVVVIAFFVMTYAYNVKSFARDSLRGDQWEWVQSVLIPYHRGDLSLFNAVTFEFEALSHSHIPTLIVFLLSYELLDLDLNPDRIIGFVALAGVLFMVFRHARRFLRLDAALAITAVASSIIFMSSSPVIFGWSLLQLQMLYVLVAFVYLRSFTVWYERKPIVHALIAMPAALFLGDAIGVAAIGATLLFLGVRALQGAASKRTLLAYGALFAVELVVISSLVRGERLHQGTSNRDFADYVISEPGEVVKGLYYSLARVFVALRPAEGASPLLEWDQAPLWVALTIVVGAVAAVLVWRTPLRAVEHFPILIILTGLIWIVGVLKGRLQGFGVDVTQTDRYAPYTTLIGVGLLLLLASKVRFEPRLRGPFMVLAASVVLVNGLGSLKITDNEVWVDRQQGELADLRAYVRDETQELDIVGQRCSREPCLRAAWFLQDMGLAAFRDADGPRATGEAKVRNLVYDRLDELSAGEKRDVCITSSLLDDATFVEWVLDEPPFALSAAIAEASREIPEDASSTADRLVVRALRSACRQSTEPRG